MWGMAENKARVLGQASGHDRHWTLNDDMKDLNIILEVRGNY